MSIFSLNSSNLLDKYYVEYQYRNHILINIEDYDNEKSVLNEINKHYKENHLIVVCSNNDLSDEIIRAVSYHKENILLLKRNVIKLSFNLDGLFYNIRYAERCGLYVVLFLYPIIPLLVPTSYILNIIDGIQPSSQCKIICGFVQFKTPTIEVPEYFSIYGKTIPNKYFKLNENNIWECTHKFQEAYTEIIQFYSKIQEMTVEFI